MTFFGKIEDRFQPVPEDRKILVEPFLKACNAGVIPFLENMGTTFVLVKKDVAGNISKLEKKLKMDPVKFATIDAMLEEEMSTKGTDLAKVGGLWLKRGLEFICALMREIIEDYKVGAKQDDMGPLTMKAYEKTLKQYHGWFTQKMIAGVTKALPSRKNFFKSLIDENVPESELISDMTVFAEELTVNVEVLNDLFNKHGLNDTSKVQ